MSKTLIIEDDAGVGEDLRKLLMLNGWSAEVCSNGLDGLQLVKQFSYDLLLLDWNLPGMPGIEICKKIRAAGVSTPIIFITGQSGIDSTEAGLEAGGDDYLTKPFSERELMARIRSIMRRPPAIVHLDQLTEGGLTFDEKKRKISSETTSVLLTATEYALITYLLRHRDESFTAAQLLSGVWHSEKDVLEDSVRVHINVLRKKLELAGLPPLISHKRGFGYRMQLPE